jgi:DNA invertase Pin-like site-specific DNA recombinase
MTARRAALQVVAGDVVFYAYLRVSSDGQEEEGMSIPVQDDETVAYGARQSRWTYGGTFRDVETGANPQRRDYQRMLAQIRADRAAGRSVAVVVVKQSRFGRDMEELARAWKEIVVQLGVEIHSTRDGGHMRDELSFLFRAVMNHNELTVISEGVRKSFARAREHGWLKPGRRRWGYDWTAATAEQRGNGSPMVVAVPHPIEADYVRELFAKRATGESLYQLATWAQQLPPEARGGRQLGRAAIRDVLRSTVYVGRNPVADGTDTLDARPGRWEPLCDEATWRTIYPRVGDRVDAVPISTRGEYPLTRFIFCEMCGARMAGHLRKAFVRVRKGRPVNEPEYRTYICSSRMAGADERRAGEPTCHRKIGADAIERQIFGALRSLISALLTPTVRERARAESTATEERSGAVGNRRRLTAATSDRKRLSDARADLTISLATREISREQHAEASGRLGEKIDALDREIARLEALVGQAERRGRERPLIDIILDQASFWDAVLEQGSAGERREVLRLLVERATPRRVGYGAYVGGLVLTSLGRHLIEVGSALLEADGQGEVVQSAWANCSTSPSPDDDRDRVLAEPRDDAA